MEKRLIERAEHWNVGLGIMVEVDYSRRKLQTFNNKTGYIYYSAPIIEETPDGLERWADFREPGKMTLEEAVNMERGQTALISLYCSAVGYKRDLNDPDRKIWRQFQDDARRNPEKYFPGQGFKPVL